MSESVATSQTAMPSTSSYQNLITAEIRVENLSATPIEQSSAILIPTSSQQPLIDMNSEPDVKRQKLDTSNPTKVKKLDLPSRLGGILCCAVCLDLPKAAMYQVSVFKISYI